MLALGQIVLLDWLLSSGYWLCRFSTFLPLSKRTCSYAMLGRVHVRMLKWVCVWECYAVLQIWPGVTKKGVVISAYEKAQAFKETENDSHCGMEEAEVCELSLGEHLFRCFRFLFRYKGNPWNNTFILILYFILNTQCTVPIWWPANGPDLITLPVVVLYGRI